MKTSTASIQFRVHPEMKELQQEAEARGWFEKGWNTLSVRWQEVRWTTDGWKTTQIAEGRDGVFQLTNCNKGTDVEFAVRLGLACHGEKNPKQVQNLSEVWLNNAGRNFRQVTA